MKTTNTETNTPAGRNVVAAPQLPSFVEFGFRRFSNECSESLVKLKEQIAAELTNEFARVLSPQLVRQVVNEADSLAATTPFPALLLPALAEEKVRTASAWAARQEVIYDQTLALVA